MSAPDHIERSAIVGEEAPPDAHRIVAHLFRREAGKLVAILSRMFGLENLDEAEDIVQDVLLKALRSWSYGTVPENPSAWIMQAAKHQALDMLRRRKILRNKEPELVALVERQLSSSDSELFLPSEVEDGQLRMMFACCHPALSVESRIALTLKTLCGFGVGEIAEAFLTQEGTIAKRIVRARQKARELRIPFEIPSGSELAGRLDSVLNVLYLLFNEGYNATHGAWLIRDDLCFEGLRLARLLAEHPVGNVPKTHALLALMLFHTARLPARVDAEGEMLLLSEQDRSLWNRGMIAEGVRRLDLAAQGDSVSGFHIEAGIAACHALAVDYETTDWKTILSLYDILLGMSSSPVVALHRAVAVMMIEGPATGIAAVESILNLHTLESYYLLHAILGDFHLRLEEYAAAELRYQRALALTNSISAKGFIARRIEQCRSGGS